MSVINSIADLRELARRRVPRAIFEYADRGSYDEVTLRRNRADLEAIELRQRVMVDVSKQALATTILGEPASFPLAIAPTGRCRSARSKMWAVRSKTPSGSSCT
jgi:L-lactate dehydrogenase (cytochrome)